MPTPISPNPAQITPSLATSAFDYDLPAELIPDRPARGASRLLHLPADRSALTGTQESTELCDAELEHHQFRALPELLRSGDLLVFNDTRVLRARLRGRRQILNGLGANAGVSQGGGAVEALLIEPLTTRSTRLRESQATRDSHWLAMLRPGKRQRPGQRLILGGLEATVVGRKGDFFELCFHCSLETVHKAMEEEGELPLPPYLGRSADTRDELDYQTHFAKAPGAVAAPTAGLHFDQPLLDALTKSGIRQASLTLHVGPGTFRPVAVEDASHHQMDSERFDIPAATIDAIVSTRQSGGRVVAVGTTVTRTLEGALAENLSSDGSARKDMRGRTDLFIVPGYDFKVIDGLITNFHLPRSTLLMLVAALVGRERVLSAYQAAVEGRYRFYSYGDAMLAWRRAP